MAASEVTQRVKVVHEGETVDADEVDFRVITEEPQVYDAGDGTKIEIKHQVKKVYRLCDKKKANGEPIYLITGTAEVKSILPSREGSK